MPSLERCIYCTAQFDSARGRGDHVIPAVLGEFVDHIMFRRLCPTCNNHIGRAEEQAYRCGPEAFYRHAVGQAKSRKRGTGSPLARGSSGKPPPLFLAIVGDHTEIVQPVPGRLKDSTTVDQLIIRCSDGSDKHFRLFAGMRADQLRRQVARAGIEAIEKAWLHCDYKYWDAFLKMIVTAYPDIKFEHLQDTEPGIRTVQGRAIFRFGSEHFRSIAKIAFHYFLAHNQRGLKGNEPEFGAIREFIMNGGPHERFFTARGPTFGLPFGRGPNGTMTSPTKWCHILAAHEAANTAVGFVYLFAGPGIHRSGYYVQLGKLPGRIELPLGAFAHIFEYDSGWDGSGKAGLVRDASITKFR